MGCIYSQVYLCNKKAELRPFYYIISLRISTASMLFQICHAPNFNERKDGYLRLNVKMLSMLAKERAIIEDNIWTNIGDPMDMNSPPQGKELRIDYANGDHLFVKFMVMQTAEQAYKKYKNEYLVNSSDVKFPITVVEVNYKIGGTGIEFKPSGTSIQTNSFKGGFISHCGVGMAINTGLVFRQNPSLLPYKPEFRLRPCPC